VVPKQDIELKLIEINENSCFLEFKHIFKQYIKEPVVQIISKDKKKILLTLKNVIEKK